MVSAAACKGCAAADGAPLQTLRIPAQPTIEFVQLLLQECLRASQQGAAALKQVLTASFCNVIINMVLELLKAEPTLLELAPAGQKVTVVGDTHGHFQDLCYLLKKFEYPSADRIYIFNGDFVDRGSWGMETLMVLLAFKWLLPHNVYLIRGNHESSYCTKTYGFKAELAKKYGKAAGKKLYDHVLELFAELPLAALVEGNTLILHGGLFRAPPVDAAGKQLYANLDAMPDAVQERLPTGSLGDLRSAFKGGKDPDPEKDMSQLIASDVLWSDPSRLPGHEANGVRNVGTRWGADVTEAFLRDNKLKLIIRSHEGPDARFKRAPNDKMPSIDGGFSIDHDTPSGKVVTLFSAPCYPMHQAAGDEPFRNKGSVIYLTSPDYASPEVQHFEAVLPRPPALLFYTLTSYSSGSMSQEVLTDSEVQGTPSVSSIGMSQSAAASDTATSSGPAASGSGGGRRRSSRLASSSVPAAGAVVPTGATSSQPRGVAAAVFGALAADSTLTVSGKKPQSPKRKRGGK